MHFSALYYVMAAPLAPFESMYAIVLLMFYNVFGLASLVSLVTRRENAALLAVVVTLFTGMRCENKEDCSGRTERVPRFVFRRLQWLWTYAQECAGMGRGICVVYGLRHVVD